VVAVITSTQGTVSSLALFLLFAMCSGCDRLHEPAIYNALDSAVELRVSWEDGRASSGTIPPHEVVHVGRPDASLREVTILRDGEILDTVSRAEIEALASEIDGGATGIVIDDAGVRALTKTELNRAYAK
jgi:hypothetical protein